ncbi:UNVERIFIED_CONTAM: hypothetical protein NCL1_38265 [Trichonephila clavipes]
MLNLNGDFVWISPGKAHVSMPFDPGSESRNPSLIARCFRDSSSYWNFKPNAELMFAFCLKFTCKKRICKVSKNALLAEVVYVFDSI